ELVGRRIQMLRAQVLAADRTAAMTQEEFGQRMGEYLGRPWSKQTVSAAEKGKRNFDLQELLAITAVLGTTLEYLLSPLDPESHIEISERHSMTADEVGRSVVAVVVEKKAEDTARIRLLEQLKRVTDQIEKGTS
ncbi:MAG: helix-turn-helix domain-containing protein, partial [Actinomycetota bacterium]|nr:helix-turn-helix domain-containing protein [Actinomycetota bacterium]